MKTTLQFLFALLLSVSFINAQEITVNTTLGAGYANQVYYKLSTETETSFTADSWDIAFLRTSAFDIGIRVNNTIEVFEASNNIADWNAIDVADEGTWTQLYNSDTTWASGALDQGTASYGWGEYNPANHHVTGSIIFVLKYADGTYRKFINEDFYGGYSIKYATWDANTSSWSADVTATIPNSNNPNNTYNYYSLVNETEVVAEPATTDWDFVFTKYYTDLGIMYPVTGVLHNAEVTVAQNEEPSGMPANPSLTYSDEINTIGYDWKAYSGGYTVDSNQAYYIKYDNGTIYRLYFTSFEGSSTGNLSFVFEEVTTPLGIEDVNNSVSFGMYPNPSTDKKVNLVYDLKKLSSSKNEVIIYSTSGQKVFETSLNDNIGFYNKTLDLSSLRNGIYVLHFTSGKTSISKKLILN